MVERVLEDTVDTVMPMH